MLTRISGVSLLVAFASVANAGMVQVELIPDNPGPYYGGESLTVDVWLHSQVDYHVGLRRVQLDFTDTDAALSLDPTFGFDYSSAPNGIAGYAATSSPDMPIPWTFMSLDCICPDYLIHLFPNDSIRIGTFGVALPTDVGTYDLDALNVNESDAQLGGRLVVSWPVPPYPLPPDVWSGFDGEITGGTFQVAVVPEPATIFSVLVLGLIILFVPRTAFNRVLRPGALLVVVLGLHSGAAGEPLPIPASEMRTTVDSGMVAITGPGDEPVVVFSHQVVVDTSWVRLHFAAVQLAGSEDPGRESFIRVTSDKDGAVQELDAFALARWKHSTAYFNGGRIRVELLAYPGTGNNRMLLDKVLAGIREDPDPTKGTLDRSMNCDVDDRTLSFDPRSGRFVFYSTVYESVVTCTGFLFDDRTNCMLTAGHCCSYADFDHEEFPPVLEFNVPLSDPDGTINHPGPEDQYPVDPDSVTFQS